MRASYWAADKGCPTPAALRDSGLILSTGTLITPNSVVTTTSVAVGEAGEISPLITEPSFSLRIEGVAAAVAMRLKIRSSCRMSSFIFKQYIIVKKL
jgi:hypothetical protein